MATTSTQGDTSVQVPMDTTQQPNDAGATAPADTNPALIIHDEMNPNDMLMNAFIVGDLMRELNNNTDVPNGCVTMYMAQWMGRMVSGSNLKNIKDSSGKKTDDKKKTFCADDIPWSRYNDKPYLEVKTAANGVLICETNPPEGFNPYADPCLKLPAKNWLYEKARKVLLKLAINATGQTPDPLILEKRTPYLKNLTKMKAEIDTVISENGKVHLMAPKQGKGGEKRQRKRYEGHKGQRFGPNAPKPTAGLTEDKWGLKWVPINLGTDVPLLVAQESADRFTANGYDRFLSTCADYYRLMITGNGSTQKAQAMRRQIEKVDRVTGSILSALTPRGEIGAFNDFIGRAKNLFVVCGPEYYRAPIALPAVFNATFNYKTQSILEWNNLFLSKTEKDGNGRKWGYRWVLGLAAFGMSFADVGYQREFINGTVHGFSGLNSDTPPVFNGYPLRENGKTTGVFGQQVFANPATHINATAATKLRYLSQLTSGGTDGDVIKRLEDQIKKEGTKTTVKIQAQKTGQATEVTINLQYTGPMTKTTAEQAAWNVRRDAFNESKPDKSERMQGDQLLEAILDRFTFKKPSMKPNAFISHMSMLLQAGIYHERMNDKVSKEKLDQLKSLYDGEMKDELIEHLTKRLKERGENVTKVKIEGAVTKFTEKLVRHIESIFVNMDPIWSKDISVDGGDDSSDDDKPQKKKKKMKNETFWDVVGRHGKYHELYEKLKEFPFKTHDEIYPAERPPYWHGQHRQYHLPNPEQVPDNMAKAYLEAVASFPNGEAAAVKNFYRKNFCHLWGETIRVLDLKCIQADLKVCPDCIRTEEEKRLHVEQSFSCDPRLGNDDPHPDDQHDYRFLVDIYSNFKDN